MNTCYISICKCFQKMKMDLQCEKAGQQLPVDGTVGTEARGHQGVTEGSQNRGAPGEHGVTDVLTGLGTVMVSSVCVHVCVKYMKLHT